MAWPGGSFFSGKIDFLGYCSREGQIHSSGSSSVFAQKGRKSRINFAW